MWTDTGNFRNSYDLIRLFSRPSLRSVNTVGLPTGAQGRNRIAVVKFNFEPKSPPIRDALVAKRTEKAQRWMMRWRQHSMNNVFFHATRGVPLKPEEGMSNPAWKPDEDSSTIYFEDTLLQGVFITSIAYGSVVTLCIQCFSMLIRDFKRSKLLRDGPLLAYVILIFMLSTTLQGLEMQLTEQAYINDRNIPGGPAAYEVVEATIPINAAGNDCLVVSTFLSDALLLWRCTIIFRNSFIPEWAVYFVVVMFWLAEFILGVLFLVQLTATSLFGAVNINLAFWSVSLAINVVATLVIVGRLYVYRRRLSGALGAGHIAQYTSVIAMVVESEMLNSMLYTVFMILYIVPFARNDALATVFVQSLSFVQAIAALMIVYRVAQGKGWTKDTYTHMTTFRAQTSTIRLNDLSALRATSTTTFADGTLGSTGTGIQIKQEVYMNNDGTTAV
ncbi:hypothetical protein NM688_g1601 [Phlebia brevispora]|uniref:Uncharacterized protein n=1 Tax=Phlebia brevispora TaxID=194682 RepID=A0ACC1TBB4_9APHY|nr:hypothetical protein NM688_g1601 [Phlebia brevispora]